MLTRTAGEKNDANNKLRACGNSVYQKKTKPRERERGNAFRFCLKDAVHASGFYLFHRRLSVIPKPKIIRKLNVYPDREILLQEVAAA